MPRWSSISDEACRKVPSMPPPSNILYSWCDNCVTVPPIVMIRGEIQPAWQFVWDIRVRTISIDVQIDTINPTLVNTTYVKAIRQIARFIQSKTNNLSVRRLLLLIPRFHTAYLHLGTSISLTLEPSEFFSTRILPLPSRARVCLHGIRR